MTRRSRIRELEENDIMCPECQAVRTDEADASLCCAGTKEHWRCTACAKVSEGFAFPYGACPLCGAALEPFEPGPVGDPVGRHAVRKAFEIELGGQAFYHRAAASTGDEALRKLFGRMAATERVHMDTLARRYHVDLAQVYDAYAIDGAAAFGGVPRGVGDADELFAIAIAMERRAEKFFETSATACKPGSASHTLYRELAAEEREHAALLEAEYARFRAGKPSPLQGEAKAIEFAARDTSTTINAAAIVLAHHGAQRVALVCGDEQVSYGALRERVARAAAAWRQRGLSRGDRVAVKLPDGIDWIVAYFGVIWAGGVAVGVNPRVPEVEWDAILDSAGFRFILAETRHDTPAPWNANVVVLDEWRAAARETEPCAATPMRPEEPVLWVHSSGTSGRPKAVVHPQRIALEIERVGRERLGITGDDRLYASSKLFFSYPIANSLFTGLKLGAAVILDAQWPTAQRVVEVARAQRASVLFSVPSLYRNLLKEGLAAQLAQAGVRMFVSAGEALPATLRDEWKRQTGTTIVNGFGASETLVLVLVDRDDGQGFRASPGIDVAPFVDVPSTGSHDAPGRILIRGSTVALGYWNRPDAQAEHFRDGAFAPSDLFQQDGRGGWRFAGREDSLVKVRGRWVDLVELEQRVALACPAVAEAAAVTVHDVDGVDTVALFFVARAGSPALDPSALREHADRLPPYQRPQWFHQLDALPRTPTGKLLRRRLRDLHYAVAQAEVAASREESGDARR
ncbi:MAG TPA: AMP-binding protein [Casimicrobiaceae bacterium]|nr:AMP-binding protein [Casimicrobiaceae bacterium]